MPDNGSSAPAARIAIPARHLGVVLLDLFERRDTVNRLDKRLTEMSANDPDREDVEARWGENDSTILDLEREARGMIEAATGVPWGFIERARL